MKKKKILFILHCSPPVHGASKVGDIIISSNQLKSDYNTKFLKITASENLGEIGKFKWKKVWLLNRLIFKVITELTRFQPDIIYFTPQPSGTAFYRDLLIAHILKCYKYFQNSPLFFHYHSKTSPEFLKSQLNRQLMTAFIKHANLIMLDPSLIRDFMDINLDKCDSINYLPNGIANNLKYEDALQIIKQKYKQTEPVNLLFLSNMIREKGYFEVLRLIKKLVFEEKINVTAHLAGAWVNENDKKQFYDFVDQNQLTAYIKHHGYADDILKHQLFSQAHFILFPTIYKKEAYPLVIIEAMQYGVIPITYRTAALPNIISDEIGVVTTNNTFGELEKAFHLAYRYYLNKEKALKCCEKFYNEYTSQIFEKKLREIFSI